MLFMQDYYRRYNRLSAWIVFGISFFTYAFTIEPTASFWDCSEYIACANKLEVGHPPGAPLFLLIGRFAALFAFGNPEHIAACINLLSALASAFTVFFLHLSITAIARKILLQTEEAYTKRVAFTVISAGVIGALSFTFSDTFWFSAIEGEVYALSSFFTAIVVWAMLRWEELADDRHADRWLVFIAYMMGLSIGVHLLNLLTIPALVMIGVFKRYAKISRLGVFLAALASIALLGGIQNILIPGIVRLCAETELLFVNSFHLPFNSGTIVYFFTLILLLVCGLFLAYWLRSRVMQTTMLALTVLLIGYSSFFVLIIRAQANPPINENNTSNAINLLSYLNREQYGDWPLLYGPNYNTPLDAEKPYGNGRPVYVRDTKSQRYIISDSRKQSIPNYDDRGCTWFPRMWNSGHASSYKIWGDVTGKSIDFSEAGDGTQVVNIPTVGENFRYLLTYQSWWMYLRYLGWNFIGRQNDRLGYGNSLDGNLQTGISPLDKIWTGDQRLLPDAQRNNKARNHYFAIPFLLGLLGLFWLFKASSRDGWVVLLLFLFTGFAIVFYLNMPPGQPRERDYAFVGSFYAFTFWIGFGAIALIDLLIGWGMRAGEKTTVFGIALACSSPIVLVHQNLDDHNRSERTAASDLAFNLLNSCAPNSILFTYADNDTFTLWFAQEVLGIRRDVRVVCLSLLRSDWYIDQMKRRQYTSDPLPITLNHWDYRDGTRDYISISAETETALSADSLVRIVTSKNSRNRYISSYGDTLNYFPTRHVFLKTNLVKKSKIEIHSENGTERSDTLFWDLPGGNYVLKDQLIILDIVAHHNWERPIYFAGNMPTSAYAGLGNYLQLEGLAYRLVPYRNPQPAPLHEHPQCSAKLSYVFLTKYFRWGGLEKEQVYADETVSRMFVEPMRQMSMLTAAALVEQKKLQEADTLIKFCMQKIPLAQAPADEKIIRFTAIAWEIGDHVLAKKLTEEQFQEFERQVMWYRSLPKLYGEYYQTAERMQQLYQFATTYKQAALANDLQERALKVGIRVQEDDENEK
jgi:hypothetical protein